MHNWIFIVLAVGLGGCPEGGGGTDWTAPAPTTPDHRADPMPTISDAAVRAIDPTNLDQTRSACRAPAMGQVHRVIDGDTIDVELSSGAKQRVRLIGVDTPELDHRHGRHDCYAQEATEFTELLLNHSVWLTFDRECRDRYDRHLAYVHIGPGPMGLWQRQLVRRGYARPLLIRPNGHHYRRLRLDRQDAERARLGLWGQCRVSPVRPYATSRK